MSEPTTDMRDALRACLATFGSRLDPWEIVIFGSRAHGSARPRSDWDLGVRGDEPMPLALFFEVQDALDAIETLHRIDWVDFGRASDSFVREAERNVEVIRARHASR